MAGITKRTAVFAAILAVSASMAACHKSNKPIHTEDGSAYIINETGDWDIIESETDLEDTGTQPITDMTSAEETAASKTSAAAQAVGTTPTKPTSKSIEKPKSGETPTVTEPAPIITNRKTQETTPSSIISSKFTNQQKDSINKYNSMRLTIMGQQTYTLNAQYSFSFFNEAPYEIAETTSVSHSNFYMKRDFKHNNQSGFSSAYYDGGTLYNYENDNLTKTSATFDPVLVFAQFAPYLREDNIKSVQQASENGIDLQYDPDDTLKSFHEELVGIPIKQYDSCEIKANFQPSSGYFTVTISSTMTGLYNNREIPIKIDENYNYYLGGSIETKPTWAN